VSIRFRAEVFEEGDDYVAICPELDVSSFGDSVAEAEESLREAVLTPSPPSRGEGWGEGAAR